MRVSTKARYALRVLVDLAEHRGDGYIPLATIAQRQGVSKKYLDQIMMLLNRTGYLKTTRGAKGGYMLAKPPEQYTLGEMLRLTEGSVAPLACLENDGEDCDRYETCRALYAWRGLYDAVLNYADNLTLQDILDQSAGCPPNDFSI